MNWRDTTDFGSEDDYHTFVETSVTVNNNSPTQDYVHPDNQTQPTFEIIIYLLIIYLPDWGKVQQGAHSPAKYCISSKVKHHPDSHYISDLMMLRQMYWIKCKGTHSL